MKLQIAIDIGSNDEIMAICDKVYDIVDIFEIGTPIIMREGMLPVKMIKNRYPNLCVLADTKIVDAGGLESLDVCQAGADILTVLAMADNETIKEVVKIAHNYQKQIMADLICVEDIETRARELLLMNVDYIAVHTGVDMQKRGRTPLKDLKVLLKSIDHNRTAVAGGISIHNADEYIQFEPGIIIAGSALYKSKDIRQATSQLKNKLY